MPTYIEEIMDNFFELQEMFLAETEYYTEQKIEEMYRVELMKGAQHG